MGIRVLAISKGLGSAIPVYADSSAQVDFFIHGYTKLRFLGQDVYFTTTHILMIIVILAILVLSIIVIVHEFGHFIIAKANGITVVEFSIGFGPKLIHFRKGETEYCIKALPFGGACTMLGDEFLEMSVIQSEEDDDDDYEDESND